MPTGDWSVASIRNKTKSRLDKMRKRLGAESYDRVINMALDCLEKQLGGKRNDKENK